MLNIKTAHGQVEIDAPISNPKFPLYITAERAAQWNEGEYEVWLLGDVEIQQGATVATAKEAVVWLLQAPAGSSEPTKAITYLEGDVKISLPGDNAKAKKPTQRIVSQNWFGRLYTYASVRFDTPIPRSAPTTMPGVYARAKRERDPDWSAADERGEGDDFRARPRDDDDVRPAQFATEESVPVGSATERVRQSAGGVRRVRMFQRQNLGWQVEDSSNPNNPGEQITSITGGVQIIIDGPDEIGTISLETDRIVVWRPRSVTLLGVGDGEGSDLGDGPIEFYMEGNIVFRQGDRLIYADRMYYNVMQDYGVVLGAEMLTPVPEYQGLVRLKADVLQQVDRQNFLGYGAAVTTSRFGVPSYWLQSERITFQDEQKSGYDSITGVPVIDPVTGETRVEHNLLATSRNNFVYAQGFPVFYWPYLATDLNRPSYYLNDASVSYDRMFGTHIHTGFDAYQLLGIRNAPKGTSWNFRNDYMSKRGFGFGSDFKYAGSSLPYLPGPYFGVLDGWYIRDNGEDNLGLNRRNLFPEQRDRFRLFGHHRQSVGDWQLTGELGLISDRNFLEQYYEKEWDTLKDQSTGVELKRILDNGSVAVSGDVRVNEFFTETNWLPRVDLFTLGQDLFGVGTYFGHTDAGYAKMQVASTPENPVEQSLFQLLPWERDEEGVRFNTKHEIDFPFELGPTKIVPYVSGQYGYWGNDLNGQSVNRFTGQGGVRASLAAWASDRSVRSELFYLNGLAHKSVLDVDFFYADSSQNMTRLPLYDNIDDNAQEHFRRRMLFNTFGLAAGDQIPLKFDERFYALRSGLQENITSPSGEIVDDLMVARVGTRQRWQTKRGAPEQERIIDWITLDSHVSLFPRPDQDNFGQVAGLADYDFKWHVGDRLSFLSDGYADFFGTGLKQINAGVLMTRPEVGNLYLGYRNTSGPFDNSVMIASANYRMTEKWIANTAASIDFANNNTVGASASVVRIGEAFLLQVGVRGDASRNIYTAFFTIEPRILPGGRLGIVGGVPLPPSGAYGIE
jgi:hypothetical protein